MRGAWPEVRAEFGRAAEIAPSPEALEGLGIAARYALDEAAAFAAHDDEVLADERLR